MVVAVLVSVGVGVHMTGMALGNVGTVANWIGKQYSYISDWHPPANLSTLMPNCVPVGQHYCATWAGSNDSVAKSDVALFVISMCAICYCSVRTAAAEVEGIRLKTRR